MLSKAFLMKGHLGYSSLQGTVDRMLTSSLSRENALTCCCSSRFADSRLISSACWRLSVWRRSLIENTSRTRLNLSNLDWCLACSSLALVTVDFMSFNFRSIEFLRFSRSRSLSAASPDASPLTTSRKPEIFLVRFSCSASRKSDFALSSKSSFFESSILASICCLSLRPLNDARSGTRSSRDRSYKASKTSRLRNFPMICFRDVDFSSKNLLRFPWAASVVMKKSSAVPISCRRTFSVSRRCSSDTSLSCKSVSSLLMLSDVLTLTSPRLLDVFFVRREILYLSPLTVISASASHVFSLSLMMCRFLSDPRSDVLNRQ